MANLYSVLPGLTVSATEILEAELLSRQILAAKYPDLDLREGTGLRDLVLRPVAYAMAMLRKASDYYFTQNTIAGVDDSTPTEVVDDIMSNWFLQRHTGTVAVIQARLYFARQKNVTLTTDIGFSLDNTLWYYPMQSKVYDSSSLAYDSFSDEWYLDVPLSAGGTGQSYNVTEGSLLYFSSFDPYFLRGEVAYLVASSTDAETNSQFLTRSSTAISTRNLVNTPSIQSKLTSDLTYVTTVLPVGYGDQEMIRDSVEAFVPGVTSLQTTGADVSGAYITYYVDTSRLSAGQEIDVYQGSPANINGRFLIDSMSSGSIVVVCPNNTGTVDRLPLVATSSTPTLIHVGGKVDVYCQSVTSTSIEQVSTDNLGRAYIDGAVLAISRSSTSGGSSADTIPTSIVNAPSTYAVNYSAATLSYSYDSSAIAELSSVTLSGVTQSTAISSISCSGLVVTATAPGHNALPGSTIVVSGVSPTAYNGTYTVSQVDADSVKYVVASNIASAGSGSSMTLGNGDLGKTAIAQLVTGSTVVISLPHLWPNSSLAPVTGSLSVSSPVAYTVGNYYAHKRYGASLTCQAGVLTLSYPDHGLVPGRQVMIVDCPQTTFNKVWVISAVPDSGTLQATAVSYPNSTTTCNFTAVTLSSDFGFSSKQRLYVDFGLANANGTASFEVEKFTYVDSVQSYLDDPANKVICADYLARGFNITRVDVLVESTSILGIADSVVASTIGGYVNGLTPGSTFIMSELISALVAAGATSLKTPVTIRYTRYLRDCLGTTTGTITDMFDPNDATNVFTLGSVTTAIT